MKKKFVILLLFAFCSIASQAQDNDASRKADLLKANARGQVVLVPLEVGQIKAGGWIRHWGQLAANGLTAHIDEYIPVFKYGWTGQVPKIDLPNYNDDGTGYSLEQTAYWLDAGIKLAYVLDNDALKRKFAERLDIVVRGVENGGETFIWWRPKEVAEDWFNNWSHGLMGRTLVSYYQATHKPEILSALVKVYKQFPLRRGCVNKLGDRLTRGAVNADALSEVYLASGDHTLLEKLRRYSEESVNPNLKISGQTPNILTEHGVTFYETTRIPAIMSIWSGSKAGLEYDKAMLDWADNTHGMPQGVASSEEYLAGIGPFRCIETCNVPASMWNYSWLLRVEGSARYADRIEHIFFNGGPMTVSRDFKNLSYYQCANRLSETLPAEPPVPGRGDITYSPIGCTLCCTASCSWTIPNYVTNMWMATLDGALAYTLYGPCTVKASLGGVPITIDCETAYPYSDHVKVKIGAPKAAKGDILLRIPTWCKGMKVKVNGSKVKGSTANGFIRITRTWNDGDVIEIGLPMSASITEGVTTPYPDDKYFNGKGETPMFPGFRAAAGQPYAVVNYGPLLFSLPLKEIDENHVVKGQHIGYALHKQLKGLKIERHTIADDFNFGIDEAPITLSLKARRFNWSPTDLQPLPQSYVEEGTDCRIKLIPYSCTKFHVTMFPVAK